MKRKVLATIMSLLLTVSLATVNVSAAVPEGESSFAAAAGTEKILEAFGLEEGTKTGDVTGKAAGESSGLEEGTPEGSGSGEAVGESFGSGEAVGESDGSGEAVGESFGSGETMGESDGAGEAVGESTGSDEGMGEDSATDGEANEDSGSGEDESGEILDTEALEAAMSGPELSVISDIEVGTALTVNTENSIVTVTFSGFPDDGWSYVFYDGSALSSTEISVEAGETIDLTGYSVSYPGYQFEGWYLTSDCSGEEVTELTVNEDITVYAKLSSEESTLTALTSDGGSLSTGSYYLDGDVTLDADIEIDYGEEVTIDLNGYTLTGVESFYVFYVYGSLTLTDSSATEDQEGTGTITGTGSSDYFICVTVYEEGTFTMNGGTITGDPEDWFLGVLTAGTFIMNGGTIACNSESHNVGVEVGGNGSFTMNGGTISGNGEYESVGVEVIYDGTFTMNGGTISGHYSSYEGGGVYIEDGAFTMTGGTITDNTAEFAGGGVVVYGSDYDTCTFTMTGGTITGNTSEFAGGGVFVSGIMKSDTSMFTMTGGTITGNRAGYAGGGVYVNGVSESDTSMFTMTGGTISENSSDYGAGGVLAYNSFTMTGGTISNNTAAAYGGVYVYGTFNMSGSPVITGNTVSDGTVTQIMNVYLEWGQWITLIGALTEGASIGVTAATILDGYSDAQITSVEDTETGYYIGASGYFTSDNADCRIEENVYGFLRLYALSDITGIVTVSGDSVYGQTLTAVLSEDVPAGAVLQWMRDGEAIIGATGSTYTLTADDVGKEITVTVSHADYLGSLTATAGTINKADQTITLESSSLIKTYGDAPFINTITGTVTGQLSFSSWKPEVATVDSDGTVTIVSAGTTNIAVFLWGDSNYNSTSVIYTLTVNPATPTVTLSDVITDKVYDGSPVSDPTVTVALVNGDTDYTQTITYYDAEGNALTDAPAAAGSYQVVVTVDAGSNYEIVSVSESFTIEASEQSISYSIASIEKTEGDSAFTNELTQTLVYGEITYESSNTSVATVDSTGKVTVVGAGTAVITATACGSSDFNEAAASYTLTVNPAPVDDSSDDTDSTAATHSGTADSASVEETEADSSTGASATSGAETGDSANMALWLTLLVAGTAALTALFTVKRKK